MCNERGKSYEKKDCIFISCNGVSSINDGSIALSVNLALSELRVMDEGETYGIENARDELAEKLELN